jgi:hypothetical protein
MRGSAVEKQKNEKDGFYIQKVRSRSKIGQRLQARLAYAVSKSRVFVGSQSDAYHHCPTIVISFARRSNHASLFRSPQYVSPTNHLFQHAGSESELLVPTTGHIFVNSRILLL